ncbi:MAG: MFS transporter [Bryobacteraceae bacterium]|nr:MFS transporter [Bryobacteraceae bacterium]
MTSRLRWTIVGLLCAGMMIAYFDRVNLSVAIADQQFKSDFELSDRDRGLLNSAFFWSYMLLQIPAGWVVDRYGTRMPYALGFLMWSMVSAASAFAGSIRQLFVLRLLLGVGESVITPAGMRWMRFHCAEQQRGLAVGLYMAAAKFGPALGTPLAAWLIHLYGWRPMFLILGLGCLIWLIPWLGLVKEDAPAPSRTQAKAEKPAGPSLGRLLLSPVIFGTVIGTFCYMYFVYFCMTWLPAYLVEARGLSLTSSGAYTAFTFSGMAVVAIAAGWLADRMIQRGGNPVRVRKGFVIAGFLLAGTEVIGAVSDSALVALFFAIFSLSGLGLVTANYWALTQTLMPGAAVGRIVGVQNCAANLPGIVAPLLTGWLKETTGSYEAPMHAIWIFLLLGVAAYLFLVREKYVPR